MTKTEIRSTKMLEIQLLDVKHGGSRLVQCDDDKPVLMSWEEVQENARQLGYDGWPWRWINEEASRCIEAHQCGKTWTPTRRSVKDIAAEWRVREAEEEKEMDAEMLRVKAERRETSADAKWWPIPSWHVPSNVRFDVDRNRAGHTIVTEYGTFSRIDEGCDRDPYMRVTDRSEAHPVTRYYMNRRHS